MRDAEEIAEYQRASGFYWVWPLALVALLREEPEASRWLRIHTRQAVLFGLLATIGYVVLLALPLFVVSLDAAITTAQTILLYSVGLLADLMAFIVLLVLASRYAGKAARGALFAIPLVSALADRILRLPA